VTGEVLLDNALIQSANRAELGATLGYLPQEVALFEGTIAENIARFGKVDSGKVIEACQLAGVHEMILRFPKNYDTEVGEGGRFLSGGQRQRIGLARALYDNPRLIVLDEPNAHLDEAGEQALFQAVQALKMRGATLVLISHRPRIMVIMDRILKLERGQILRLASPEIMLKDRQGGDNPSTSFAPLPAPA
jgi:ATP-binding cassette subfamily C exporter for protease/lipase